MSNETGYTLNPAQRRLLSLFVREYEAARDDASSVQAQAQTAVQQANAVRDAAYQRLIRAAELALGGGVDVAVDFVTWEVHSAEKVAEQDETT